MHRRGENRILSSCSPVAQPRAVSRPAVLSGCFKAFQRSLGFMDKGIFKNRSVV